MAYEPKPGQFTLFKNDRKEKDSHPDYKGDGMDLDGNPVWVSAWIKAGNKGKFMSCSMQKKEAAAPKPAPKAPPKGGSGFDDLSDEPPF